jgi:hypothetical protein
MFAAYFILHLRLMFNHVISLPCIEAWDKGETKCNGSDTQDTGTEGAVWSRGSSKASAPLA